MKRMVFEGEIQIYSPLPVYDPVVFIDKPERALGEWILDRLKQRPACGEYTSLGHVRVTIEPIEKE